MHAGQLIQFFVTTFNNNEVNSVLWMFIFAHKVFKIIIPFTQQQLVCHCQCRCPATISALTFYLDCYRKTTVIFQGYFFCFKVV